jgi:hypothetical protein
MRRKCFEKACPAESGSSRYRRPTMRAQMKWEVKREKGVSDLTHKPGNIKQQKNAAFARCAKR